MNDNKIVLELSPERMGRIYVIQDGNTVADEPVVPTIESIVAAVNKQNKLYSNIEQILWIGPSDFIKPFQSVFIKPEEVESQTEEEKETVE